MERYKNINGDSGVTGYIVGDDFIWVQFNDGMRYEYTYARTGSASVEKMKLLAIEGRGLNSFIQQNPNVRMGYARKER